MLKKSTFREIKGSLGRYLAILAIVALGVGFFAGLKVTQEAMVTTAGNYLAGQNFFDYRLLSTLGFEEDDVNALAKEESVNHAEGSISTDALYHMDAEESNSVMMFHSMTNEINQLILKDGRLPEKANECVVDHSLITSEDIGKTIFVAEENEEDTLDMFKYKEYTIVGTVVSPLYLNFERGTTSLGNGTVAGFAYLLEEGFDTDYYTEIYLDTDAKGMIYSDEYETAIDEAEASIKAATELRADIRYQSIIDEAKEELADGQKEYDENYAKYLSEKADAEAELADAYQEILDGQQEIKDNREELTTTKEELLTTKSDLKTQKSELETQKSDLEKQKADLKTQKSELTTQKAELETQKASLEPQKTDLTTQKTTLETQRADLVAQKTALETQKSELETTKAQVEAGLSQVATQRAEFEASKSYMTPEQIAETETQLSTTEATLTAQLEQINGGITEVDNGIAQIDAGIIQIDGALSQINTGLFQIDSGLTQIEEAIPQIDAGLTQIEEAIPQIDAGIIKIDDGITQIDEGMAEIEDGLIQIDEGFAKLDDAEIELAEGLEEYNEGKAEAEAEFADAEKEFADAREELEEAEEEINDIEAPDVYVLDRMTNVGYACYESDSAIVDGIARVFPIFFFLVAALVCMTTMTRMVDEQRTQIGVLKALGYSNGAITAKYLFYSGSAALIGCLIGFFGGCWLFPKVIWIAYGMMYDFSADIVYILNPALGIICLVVALLCSMGATLFSCYADFGEVPAQLIRPKAPKEGKRILLERIGFIWNRLGFLYKVSFRNIFRYKKRFFMMVLGISGCTALLVAGFGINDSVKNIVNDQYDQIQLYDCSITFDKEMTETRQARFEKKVTDDVEDMIFVYQNTADLVTSGKVKDINLIASDAENFGQFIDLHTEDGEPVAYPAKGEAVICNNLADDFDLDIGDTITLRDEDMNEVEVKVGGIYQNFVYNYILVAPETLADGWGYTPEKKTAYVHLNAEKDDNEAIYQSAANFLNQDRVVTVTVNNDLRDRVNNMMESLNYVIILVVVCAGALAFIVLYNLTNINITERIREIATIKVLGFYPNETSAYVFRENIFLTGISAVVGLFLGKALLTFIIDQIQVDLMCFNDQIAPLSYLASFLLTFVFSALVSLAMYYKLERISMTESLKSIE